MWFWLAIVDFEDALFTFLWLWYFVCGQQIRSNYEIMEEKNIGFFCTLQFDNLDILVDGLIWRRFNLETLIWRQFNLDMVLIWRRF